MLQVDFCLEAMRSGAHLAIGLKSRVVDGHVATGIIWNALEGLPGIRVSRMDFGERDFHLGSDGTYLSLTWNGDMHVVEPLTDGQFLATLRTVGGGIENSALGTWVDLSDELGFIGEVWRLERVDDRAAAAAHGEDVAEYGLRDFVIGHFLRLGPLVFKVVGASMAVTLATIATPLGFQTFADKILPYAAHSSLTAVTILLVLSALAASILSCYKNYQQSVLLARYQNGLGKEVFARLISMDVPYLLRHKVGDLTKLVDQVEEAANFLARQLLGTVTAVLSLLVVLPLLFIYNARLAVIVVIVGLIMALTVALALSPLRRRIERAYQYDASFQSTLIETLKGMQTVKALTAESHFLQRANHSLEVNLYGRFTVSRLHHVVGAILGFQSQLISVIVILFGAQAVFANQMTIGQLIAFNMLANNVVGPLVSVVLTAAGLENFRLARAKLRELVPPDHGDLLDSEMIALRGDIEFENVWFRYPGTEAWVLKDVNLTIRQGEMFGVVGASGSGKSTLMTLLMGFYAPTRGSIRINGYDISMLSPNRLRNGIASVQQTSFLFNSSVLENVHLGRLDAGYADVVGAMTKSGAEEFVSKLPQQYLTTLTEDGGNLSGGQRQRLAIARALVRGADIMLFDEATSALDVETEMQIRHAIHTACQGKTGLIIAHRLDTLADCTRLVVMRQGGIEAVGKHEELIIGDNSYRRMLQGKSGLAAAPDEPMN